jgi:ACS family hexuronate transporter-like MFS transporter
MYLGSGVLVDRWGTRTSLAVFVLWWSVANVLHAFARTAWHFAAFRVLLGIGEPGNFMAATRAVSEWYLPKERAIANGLVQAGATIGGVLAPPVVVWILYRYNWQMAFVVTGSLGFVWVALWLYFYRLPATHPRITGEERALLAEVAPRVAARVRWASLLRHRQTWGLVVGRFFSDPVWWFYLIWLPKFLVEQRGFSMQEVGTLGWLPYLTADAGALAGGVISGHLVNRRWPAIRARFGGMLPFAMVMPLSLVIVYTKSTAATLTIISVITFAHMAWKTNMMTLTNDIYPTHVVGSLSGIVAFGNGLGGTLFTFLAGRVVAHYSYDALFVVMAFLHPTAYVLMRWLVRGPIDTGGSQR